MEFRPAPFALSNPLSTKYDFPTPCHLRIEHYPRQYSTSGTKARQTYLPFSDIPRVSSHTPTSSASCTFLSKPPSCRSFPPRPSSPYSSSPLRVIIGRQPSLRMGQHSSSPTLTTRSPQFPSFRPLLYHYPRPTNHRARLLNLNR